MVPPPVSLKVSDPIIPGSARPRNIIGTETGKGRIVPDPALSPDYSALTAFSIRSTASSSVALGQAMFNRI